MNQKKKMGQRGQMGVAFAFIIFSLFVILFFTFIMPMSQKLNTESYKTAELVTQSSMDSAQGITDQNVREAVLGIYQEQKDSFVEQASTTSAFIRYGWFFVIIIIAVGLFLVTRRNVEAQGGVA